MNTTKNEAGKSFDWSDRSAIVPNSPLAEKIYKQERLSICQQTDRMFGWLMILQWLASLLVAIIVSPYSWAGRDSFIHPHIYFVTVLGSLITVFPVYLAFRHAGEPVTRFVMAVCQMIYSGMLIHLTGGRIESHFHIFGSLAFLSFYRDWRVLALASLVTLVDHALRGIYIPESIYGVALASPWRTVEHVWWVIFEDLFLISAGYQSLSAMMANANKQAELEVTRSKVEELVNERTGQLDASENRYRVLCETAPLGIFQATGDGQCIYINTRFAEIFGLTYEEALRDGWSHTVPSDQLEFVGSAWLAAVSGSGIFDLQFKINSEKPCWVHSKASRVVAAKDGVETYVGTVEDVTERVLAEQARAERALVQARLASIVEYSNDAIVGKSLQGVISSWNPAADRLFGWSSEEMIGHTIASLLPDDKREEDAAMLSRILSGEKVGEFETTRLCKDGRAIDVALTCSLMLDNQGQAIGVSIIYRDISHRKEVEKRLSEFYSTISHELRSPLTSIRGALSLIDDKIIEMGSDECYEMIGVARSSSERLVRLINDILDIKKIEAGKLELKLEKIDAATLVSRAVAGMEGLARAHNIQLIQDTVFSAPVKVDIDRIIQVLTNLISNAIKFSSDGGCVIVGLNLQPDAQLRFSIADQGAGIPVHLQSKLFQRFQQVDSSDTRPKEGTGLGLALSKAIVEEHKGLIGVYSSTSTGSTFWFDLPIVDAEVKVSLLPQLGASAILLVEDDDNIAQFMRLSLLKHGYQILRVATIAAAIDVLSRSRPGLILLDLNLPDGNGLDILQYLKEEFPDDAVPVIVTTGIACDKVSLAYPVVLDCFFKPFEMSLLLKSVEKAIHIGPSRRILLVEDDQATRSVIAKQLAAIGATCMEASNGLEALTVVESFVPDLIILDVGLPKLDGFEVISVLQKGPFALVPLLVYSAQELTESDRGKLSLGLTRYLDKGRISPEEFIASVQELLGQLKVGS
ncbi:MAG: PAS domain S-box protein [Candidatus Melainabacteria bacterium]|nr:PAS domain S-box protein [Candidatus Melainabacteria bacterium]